MVVAVVVAAVAANSLAVALRWPPDVSRSRPASKISIALNVRGVLFFPPFSL